jgi:hypothetical protein
MVPSHMLIVGGVAGADMLRRVLAAVALLELLLPARVVDVAERLALAESGGCERKRRVVPLARLEGLVFLAVTLGPDRWRVRFKQFLGVLGVVALLAPRAFVDAGTRFAYTGAEGCTWHEWVYPATRVIGLGYILVAVDELRGE